MDFLFSSAKISRIEKDIIEYFDTLDMVLADPKEKKYGYFNSRKDWLFR